MRHKEESTWSRQTRSKRPGLFAPAGAAARSRWRAGARTAQVRNSATAVVDATRACLSPPRASGKLEGNSDTEHSNEVRLELGPIQVLHDRHLDRGLENQAVRHELHTG